MKSRRFHACLLALSGVLLLPAQGALDKASLQRELKEGSPAAAMEARVRATAHLMSGKLKQEVQKNLHQMQRDEAVATRRVMQCFDRVQREKNINARSEGGLTLLMAACASGNLAVTEMVLAENPALDLKDNEGRTALQHEREGGGSILRTRLTPQWQAAVDKGDKEKVRYLLDCGVSPSESVLGNPPLGLAIEREDKELFDMLAEHGPVVTVAMSDGRTLLELALDKRNADAVGYILSYGASAEDALSNGDSLPHRLLAMGDVACVAAYLKTDPPTEMADGTTFPCMAVRFSTPDVVKEVLENCPRSDAEDACGNTPLLEAARRGDPAVWDAVLTALPNAARTNKRKETVLMHAALGGNAELVQKAAALLTAEECRAADAKGQTAADYAALLPDNPALPAVEAAMQK